MTKLHEQTILERIADMLKVSDIPQQVIDRHWGELADKENRNKIENEIKSYFNKMIESHPNFYEINKKVNCSVEYNIDDYGERYLKVEFEIPSTTTCMSDEEFKRMTEAATDALTDMELKGYDIECKLRGVENVHLNNSKRNNNK